MCIRDRVPDFLNVLDKALVKQLSSYLVEMSIESYSGMAGFYRKDLAGATNGITDFEVIKEFNQAR